MCFVPFLLRTIGGNEFHSNTSHWQCSSNSENISQQFFLGQNYSNPFNPSTTISFALSKDARVSLQVFTLLGQKAATIIDNGEFSSGVHRIEFNGSELSSGMYFYRLDSKKHTAIKKLVILK